MNAKKILTAGPAANVHRRSLGLSAKPADGVAKGANAGIAAPSRWLSFLKLALVFMVIPGPVWSVNNPVCQYPAQSGTDYAGSRCNTTSGLTWPTTWTTVTANDVANDEAAGGADNDIVGIAI